MDRIIYFYVTRDKSAEAPGCRVYKYKRRDYELLRAGLSPWLVERWKRTERTEAGREQEQRLLRVSREGAGLSSSAERIFKKIRGFFASIRKRTLERKAAEEEKLFWQQQLERVTEQIADCLGERGALEEVRFSCDDRLLPLLVPKGDTCGAAGSIWRQRWQIPLFEQYGELFWVEHLMQRAALHHFLILGYHKELPELLCRYAVRMKSLKWILPERLYSEALQEFLEDFYEEYGVAAAVQVLNEGEDYRKAGITCREPSNILDFSEEEKIPTGGIAEESIWLDMNSSEEKCRRVEGRNTGIHYFSLKKEWKQPVLP